MVLGWAVSKVLVLELRRRLFIRRMCSPLLSLLVDLKMAIWVCGLRGLRARNYVVVKLSMLLFIIMTRGSRATPFF